MSNRKKLEKEILSMIKVLAGDTLRKNNPSLRDIKSTHRSLEQIEVTAFVYLRILKNRLADKLKEQGKL